MSETIASAYRACGFRFVSRTSHPAMMKHRSRSDKWKMKAVADMNTRNQKGLHTKTSQKPQIRSYEFAKRLRFTFEYVGASMDRAQAQALINNLQPDGV